jgi:hypothetical protein
MKWLFFGVLDPDLRKSSDDCAACRRAFEKRASKVVSGPGPASSVDERTETPK